MSICNVLTCVLTTRLLEHDRRTAAEHRAAAGQYALLSTDSERAKFLKRKAQPTSPGGYRATCLLQLPYWDGARMIVVDPMHCLFLGKLSVVFGAA